MTISELSKHHKVQEKIIGEWWRTGETWAGAKENLVWIRDNAMDHQDRTTQKAAQTILIGMIVVDNCRSDEA